MKSFLKSLALADGILEPEWEYRYFSFDSNWSENSEMASMRDGQGGHWFVLFEGDLVGYKCISPEDGLMDNLDVIKNEIPEQYIEFINEPAFYVNEATSIWVKLNNEWLEYGKNDVEWIIDLQKILKWDFTNYKSWAEEYYEKEIAIEPIKLIFENNFTKETLKSLNPDVTNEHIMELLNEVGL